MSVAIHEPSNTQWYFFTFHSSPVGIPWLNRGPFRFVKKWHRGRPPRSSLHVSRGTKAWEICRDLGNPAMDQSHRAITGDEPPEELLSYLWGFHLRLQFESRGLKIKLQLGHISSYINVTWMKCPHLLVQLKSWGRLRNVTIFSADGSHLFRHGSTGTKYDLQWLEIVDTLTA